MINKRQLKSKLEKKYGIVVGEITLSMIMAHLTGKREDKFDIRGRSLKTGKPLEIKSSVRDILGG